MSEVIEDYIRRNPGVTQSEALDMFLNEDRIKQWVAGDPVRRDRIQREFARVWATMNSGPQVQVAKPPMPKPAAPAAPPPSPAPKPAPVVKKPEPAPPPLPAPIDDELDVELAPPPKPKTAPRKPRPIGEPEARKMQLMCTSCGRYAIFAQGIEVACVACGTTFENMLELIPVRPLGPFAFVFGEGWRGIVVATLIVLFLVAVYGVLRWV